MTSFPMHFVWRKASRVAPLSFRVLKKQRRLARALSREMARRKEAFWLRPLIPIAATLAFGSALGPQLPVAAENATRAAPLVGFLLASLQILLIFALLVAFKTSGESRMRAMDGITLFFHRRAFFRDEKRARVLAKVLRALLARPFALAATLLVSLVVATAFAAAQRQLPPPRDVSHLARLVQIGAKELPRVTLTGTIAAPPRHNEFTVEFPLRCRTARVAGRDQKVSGQVWIVLPRADANSSATQTEVFSPARAAHNAAKLSENRREYSRGGESTRDNNDESFAAGDLVKVRAALYDIPRAFNTGQVTRESFYIEQNCWCVARAESFRGAKTLRSAQGFSRLLNQTRRGIAALYEARLASTRSDENAISEKDDSGNSQNFASTRGNEESVRQSSNFDTSQSSASTRSDENAAPLRPYQRATSVLLTSLIFGEGGLREALPRATRERYRAAGLSHLLVASGTQISLLAGMAILLARFFSLRGVALIFFTAIPLWFYSALAGGEASISRAAIAGFCVVAALSLGRAFDALSLWSLALGALLLLDPAQIFNIGLQLSFAATWGLLALSPALRVLATPRAPSMVAARGAQMQSKKSWLPAPIALLLAVQMATFPVQLAHFGTFSAVALPANAAALPLAGFITLFGILALISSAFAAPAYGFTRALDALCSLAASASGAQLSDLSVSRGALLLLVALPFALCSAAAVALALQSSGGAWRDLRIIARHETIRFARNFRRKMGFSPQRAGKFFAAAALLLALLIFLNMRRGPLRVAFLDVGQGDSIVVRTPSGKTILIDGGSGDARRGDMARGVIVPYLQSLGANQIDALIMTHADSDHCNALAGVMREVPTKLVIDGAAGTDASGDPSGEYSRLKRLWRAQKVPVQPARSGQIIDCGDGVHLRVLAPRGGMNGLSENNRSAVTRLQYGEISMLFTGDLEEDGEEVLLESGQNLRATVLKVGHHGSRGASSAAFLKRVAPRVAVISCGRFNRYGHPAQDALSRLESSGAEVFRTDRDGEVSLSCDESNCEVTTFR